MSWRHLTTQNLRTSYEKCNDLLQYLEDPNLKRLIFKRVQPAIS